MTRFEINYYKTSKKGNRASITRKRTIINKIIAWERGREYYDGDRLNGYGGFKYDGRWKNILPKFIKRYKLTSGSKVLDVGCKKGFLLNDLAELVPGIKIYGIEDHYYPLRKSMKKVKKNLIFSNYYDLPFKKPLQQFQFEEKVGFKIGNSPRKHIGTVCSISITTERRRGHEFSKWHPRNGITYEIDCEGIKIEVDSKNIYSLN